MYKNVYFIEGFTMPIPYKSALIYPQELEQFVIYTGKPVIWFNDNGKPWYIYQNPYKKNYAITKEL